MKIKFLLIIPGLLCSLLGNAQTYFTESFEGTWSGTVSSPVNMNQTIIQPGTGSGSDIYWNQSLWNSTSWSPAGNGAPSTGAPNGTAAARFNDYNAKSGEIVLLSSKTNVDLSSATNPVCEFYYAYKTGNVKLKLVASLDGGSNWEDLSSDISGNGGAWQKMSYTIPANYKVANARIGFKITGSFGMNGFWLDHIVVKESLTPLHGVKTIAASGADYNSFAAAINDLNLRGVDGAVTFQVANGTYNEQVVISSVVGASSVNTITFTGTDSANCTLNTNVDNSSANYTLKLNGADFISFQKMKIKHKVITHSVVLELSGGANNNSFMECVFEGVESNDEIDLNGSRVLFFSGTSVDSSNSFTQCKFNGGSYAVYLSSLASSESNNSFSNNTFQNFTTGAINIESQENFSFINNILTSSATKGDATMHGLRIISSEKNLTISGNQIYVKGADYCDGIYLNSYSGDGNLYFGRIFNNFIICQNGNSTGQCIGINSYKSRDLDLANNSILIIDGSSSQTECLYLNSDGLNFQSGNNRVLNNVLVNLSGGVLINFTSQAVSDDYIKYCDHNVLFSPDSNLIRYQGAIYKDMVLWGNVADFDTNSLFIDPKFISNSNLHIADSYIDSVGIPVSYITVDIDNDVRSSTIPDAGADEDWIITYLAEQNHRKNDLIVYPNPVSGILNIKGLEMETLVTLTDLTGKCVWSEMVLTENPVLDLSEIQNGLYMLFMKNNNTLQAYKIQIIH